MMLSSGVNSHLYTYVVFDNHIVEGVNYCNGQDRAHLVLMSIKYKIMKIHSFYFLLLMYAKGITFWDAKSQRLHCTRYFTRTRYRALLPLDSGRTRTPDVSLCPFRVSVPAP